MGKVDPNHWSNDQRTLRTNLVRTEDKTTWYTWLRMRTQTCVKVVMLPYLLGVVDPQLQWMHDQNWLLDHSAPCSVSKLSYYLVPNMCCLCCVLQLLANPCTWFVTFIWWVALILSFLVDLLSCSSTVLWILIYLCQNYWIQFVFLHFNCKLTYWTILITALICCILLMPTKCSECNVLQTW